MSIIEMYSLFMVLSIFAIIIFNNAVLKDGHCGWMLVPIWVLVGIFVMTCTVTIDDDSYGFYGDKILAPGSGHLKWPWDHIDTFNTDYKSVEVKIPCQTSDGMRLNYHLTYLFITIDPVAYRALYHHDMEMFKLKISNQMKPYIDERMRSISERDFETDNVDRDELQEDFESHAPRNGIRWDPTTINKVGMVSSHFDHIDEPSDDYFCERNKEYC